MDRNRGGGSSGEKLASRDIHLFGEKGKATRRTVKALTEPAAPFKCPDRAAQKTQNASRVPACDILFVVTGAIGAGGEAGPREFFSIEEKNTASLSSAGQSHSSDSDLLAALLRTSVCAEAARDVANHLLQRYGSLGGLSRCSVSELSRIRGVGPSRAVHLVAAFGLAARLSRESVQREKIDSPERVFQLLGVEMRTLSKESLRVILLDTRYQLMRVEEISRGTVNESIAHPRDIFEPVVTAVAYAFVLVHNHPSGDPTPSDADRRLTTRLAEGARLLQVQMLDHVILGSPDNGRHPWFSFKNAGFL